MVGRWSPVETGWARAPSPLAIAATALTALGVAMGIGRFAFTPILPMMQQDAGVSVAQGAWLASANYLGYLLGALSALILRARPATAIRSGLVVIGLATLAMGVAPSFAAWLALRALAGVASAWVLVFGSAWALAALPATGPPVLRGTVFAGVGAGIAVAGAFCGVLMQRGATSPTAWRGLGVIALIGTAAVWRILGVRDDAAPRQGRQPRGLARRWDSDTVALALCYGAFGFGYIIPATFVPAMARELVRDPRITAWSWPVFGIAAVVSTLVVAEATRFVSNRRLWALGHLVMAIGVAAPVVWPTVGGILTAALLVGGTFMVNTMAGMQEAKIVGGSRSTGLMAALTAAFATGQVAGPLFVTHAVGAGGDFSRPLLTASLLLLVSAVALFRARPERAASPLDHVETGPS
ncbi:MAG TPA: YbfB/YjiJ family MFS transporter [Candidatus Methylomirabilis sp.]|nr:YbfB/YjiJ family MFS transporter [Candidatus Methylomirabilis sp.]